MWCSAYAPPATQAGHTIKVSCDGAARTVVLTCVPIPAFWFDSNGVTADGCERSYGIAAADLLLREDRTLVVSATCAGSLIVGCPSGTPQDPPGTLDWIANPTTIQVVYQNGQRFDLSTSAFLRSGPIPVNIAGSDCTMTVNTQAGSRPDVDVAVQLNIPSDPVTGEYTPMLGEVVLGGLSPEDVTVGGGGACGFTPVPPGAASELVRRVLDESLLQRICLAPEPDLIEYCEA